MASHPGLDFVVTLRSEGKPGFREFGVGLKGAWAEATAERADATLRPALERMLRPGPYPFPVALFLFTMQDGAAWFTWAVEPVVDSSGAGQLITRRAAHSRPLNDATHDEIIARVHTYYDAFFTQAGRVSGQPRPS